MNDEYDGDELCFQCNRDFPFIVIPSKGVEITCPYCGQVQHPCSLCDMDIVDCSGDCKQNIIKSLTWDEIYQRADGSAYGDDELTAKDNARWEVRNYVLDKLGIDIEDAEIPEEEVEYYTDLYHIEFNENGYIVKGR